MAMIRAVILAAGASSRMGSPKALADLGGVTLLDLHLSRLRAAVDEVVVVLGCHREAIEASCDLGDAARVVNESWREGMASSLRCGLRAARAEGGCLVSPVDCPPPLPETLKALLDGRRPGIGALIPTFEGRGGHPVWLSMATIDALLTPADPPRLDHALAALGEGVATVPTSDRTILENINNQEDLERLRARLGSLGQKG